MTHENRDDTSSRVLSTAVLCQLRKHRDFVAERAKVDIFLKDGTLVMAGASLLPMLDNLDKAIDIFSHHLSLRADA